MTVPKEMPDASADVASVPAQPLVLPEYTDAHLFEGVVRQDSYGERCRLLLTLPAELRQEASAESWRATHHTPTEFRWTDSGLMESFVGSTQVVGDWNAVLAEVVSRINGGTR
jgi:hypothetical protein